MPAEVKARMEKPADGRSILDAVAGQPKELQRGVTARDRLDQ